MRLSATREFSPVACVLVVGMATASAQSLPPSQPAAASGGLAYGAPSHDALVLDLRAGRVTPTQAIEQLSLWLAMPLSDKEQKRVASDAIVIAVDGGQFAEAADLGLRLSPERLDDYALGPLVQAARRTGRMSFREAVIGLWRARLPAAPEPRIHEAWWRLDSGDVAGAKALSMALQAERGRLGESGAELLELDAAVARADRRPQQAVASYTAASLLRPDRLDLRREADFLLADSGGASAAFEDAEAAELARPGTFSDLGLSMLQQQALAQRLRWAIEERDQRLGATRLTALDRVLDEQTAALVRLDAAALQAGGRDAEAWRALRVQLQSDRLLALYERGQPAQVIALYQTLRSEPELPFHALSAAAQAFSQERRSAEAVPIYEAAIAMGGDDLAMSEGLYLELVYAYMLTGRFEESESLLTRLEANTPVFMRLSPEAGRPNGQYADVSAMRGFLQLYTDQPALAQQRFTALTEQAPFNPGFGTAAGLTERLREHPDAALDRLEALVVDHPHDIGVRVGHVEALLDTGWYGQARQRAESLVTDAGDAAAVRDMERRRNAIVGPRLAVNADAARAGAAIASREWRIDSRLSSRLLQDEWRVFYDQSLGQGETELGDANWARGGLGLNWQRGRWLAEGVVQQANGGPYRTSLGGRVDYRASDSWRFSARYDGDSKDAPWRARAAGIAAREAGARVDYIVNESRAFDLRWQRLDFSDNNVRNGLDLGWRERWVSTPRLQFETRLGAGTSSGRTVNTPYFNPAGDASVNLSSRIQWLNWKRDDRQFFQAVEVGAGRYRQDGFGAGPMWSLRYEHLWSLGPTFVLRYGLSLSSHPYDGVRERERGVFLNLSMPLP